MDQNQAVYERVAETYTELALLPAERAVLTRLAPTLAETDMLDLGVGGGRTGYTFAPLVHRYVGVDYSQRMLERAQRLLGADANVELVLGDARDLSTVPGPFGFVLFSFNGIDAAAPDERLLILAQIRSVLRDDGWLLFSAHSLGALPLSPRRERPERWQRSRAYRAYAAFDDLRFRRRVAGINRSIDLEQARNRGWTVVNGRGHAGIVECYVDPEFQVRQLSEAGLEPVAILDPAGNRVELPHKGRDPSLSYLCKPAI
jgi:SAM-dependent methyltransferase